jgi:hypothetical protein
MCSKKKKQNGNDRDTGAGARNRLKLKTFDRQPYEHHASADRFIFRKTEHPLAVDLSVFPYNQTTAKIQLACLHSSISLIAQ